MNPFRTRMNRLQFAVSFVLLLVVLLVATIVTSIVPLVGMPLLLVLVVYVWSPLTRRLQDIGWSSYWLAPCLFFPPVLLLFWTLLLFIKGQEGPNKYGPVPTGFSVKSILIGTSPADGATSVTPGAATSDEQVTYVRTQLQSGHDEQSITDTLTGSGYAPEQIRRLFTQARKTSSAQGAVPSSPVETSSEQPVEQQQSEPENTKHGF